MSTLRLSALCLLALVCWGAVPVTVSVAQAQTVPQNQGRDDNDWERVVKQNYWIQDRVPDLEGIEPRNHEKKTQVVFPQIQEQLPDLEGIDMELEKRKRRTRFLIFKGLLSVCIAMRFIRYIFGVLFGQPTHETAGQPVKETVLDAS